MKISVIIPFYSRVDWLIEAVESVFDQTFTDYEVIIVNDGSPEDDKLFVEKFGEKVNYFKTENKGPAHARNFGIAKAKGKYIAFLDSDDIWLPTKLEKQVKYMEKNGLVWSHTNYYTFLDIDDSNLKSINNLNFKGNVFPKSFSRLNIGTPCVMILRSYLMDNLDYRFSEEMRFGQDGFFWMIMSVENELGYVEESLTKVRMRGNNAVLRAYAHLYVRSNLYLNLISKFQFIFEGKELSFILKLNYKMCNYLFRLINKLSSRPTTREILSRILYLPNYLLFRLYYIL